MQRKPTSKDVANFAGCSQTTVSFVLSNRKDITISEATRKRVIEAAKALNYIPNQFAKGLKTNRSNLIGVMVPSMTHPTFQTETQAIEEYATLLGYNVIVCNVYRQPNREIEQLKLLIEKSIDGVIFTYMPSNLPLLKEIAGTVEIVVICDTSNDPVVNMVCNNGYEEGRLVAEYLLSLGHKKIACITTSFSDSFKHRERREKGIEDVLSEHGLSEFFTLQAFESNEVFSYFPHEVEIGYSAAKEIVSAQGATAIIGTNDLIALGAINYIITETNLKIPHDISICGFNDIYWGELLNPKLTTVNHNFSKRSRLAVDLLIESINQQTHTPQKILCDSRLVVRATTAPVPQ